MYDSLDNRMRPSRGQRFVLNQDVAGLGGTVRYVRSRVNYDRYFRLPGNFILNLGGEAGNIFGLGGQDIRLSERFYLGEPRFRGFAIRGVGPRVVRKYRDADGNLSTDRKTWSDDALGGRNYYLGRAEVEVPLGSAGREMGLRPSIFVDVGALWNVKVPELLDIPNKSTTVCTDPNNPTTCTTTSTTGFKEFAYGNSSSPRVSVGVGVSWNSPFGPFRFDLAKAIKSVEGDDTQIFQFNVGTQF